MALLWPLAALVIAAVGWELALSNLEHDKLLLEKQVQDKAEVLAESYASHLALTLEEIDRIALHVRYDWQASNGKLSLEQARNAGLFPSTSIFYVGIVGPDGLPIADTLPARGNIFLGDREYFLAQKTATQDLLYIGGPAVGRATKKSSIFFSRRILKPDGSFDGVVLLSVSPAYFTTGYNDSALEANGLVGLIGDDHVILTTRTGQTIYPPGAPAFISAPLFGPRAGGSTLLDGNEWFEDKRSRYVGWRAVKGYPLTAVVGLDTAAVLEPFRLHKEQALQNTRWATMALAIFALIAAALSLRLAWRKHNMELMQNTYRMATEGGNEGFYIARPIWQKDDSIADFEIIDCNQRGAELVRHRREELIGKSVLSLYAGADPDRMLGMLREAMQMGAFEVEVEVQSDSPFVTRWAHLKIMRSDGDLAVTLRDISDAKAHIAELERIGDEDALTGLPNRHWVQNHLPKAIKHATENHAMLAILFIDLDGFKEVNDRMGHAAGDEVLRNAARRIKDAIRPHDCVVRLSGDEFVVILETLAHETDAAHVAERILQAFQDAFRFPAGIHSLGASIGISVFPDDGADADTLLQHADIAMYSVKTSGKRNYRFYDERFYESLRARLEREAELRHAIQHDQFVMYYQPRIEVATGMTSSMEALVRWVHPTKGLISPVEFISLAEETDVILSLGEMVIDKVCAQLAAWAKEGKDPIPVSINVSSRQFNETDIAEILLTALTRHKIDATLIEIELTESSMMGDSQEVARTLIAIRRMGIKLLVDDFGTGYSSLAQLQRLDFDLLKVDQAFTARLDKTSEGSVFFLAIITMAHALGMRVVAEGVETETQAEILKSLQCDELQGFYISRPLSPSELESFPLRRFLPSGM